MSDSSLSIAAALFVLLPTVGIGGASLLYMIRKREPGYLDNPTRRAFFVAGHAHAGVWIILALIGLRYVDAADLSNGAKAVVRNSLWLAPLFISAGFFLSMARHDATKPNRLIWLVYAGAVLMVVATVTLGIGLWRAT